MVNVTLMRRIANEVDTLLSQNPKAKDSFSEQLKIANNDWRKYWSEKGNELPILEQRPDKSKKDAYEYDRHFKLWFPKHSTTLPPDPLNWESDNKYSSYYATLAVIYDLEKSKAPFRLCEGILDPLAIAFMQRYIYVRIFDEDDLEMALKWVKDDLRQQQEKGGQALREPLSKKARLIYEKLNKLEPHEAMTLPEIQDWIYDKHEINLDEGTWKNIRKELEPYGLKNKPRIGYFIRK